MGKTRMWFNRAMQVAAAEYMQKTKQTPRDIGIIDGFKKWSDHEKDAPEGVYDRVYYLGRAINRMAAADVVVFGKGWEDALGCRIEHKVCEDYGIDIFECEGLK